MRVTKKARQQRRRAVTLVRLASRTLPIAIFGLAGNDLVDVQGTLNVPLRISGGNGTDTLEHDSQDDSPNIWQLVESAVSSPPAPAAIRSSVLDDLPGPIL